MLFQQTNRNTIAPLVLLRMKYLNERISFHRSGYQLPQCTGSFPMDDANLNLLTHKSGINKPFKVASRFLWQHAPDIQFVFKPAVIPDIRAQALVRLDLNRCGGRNKLT